MGLSPVLAVTNNATVDIGMQITHHDSGIIFLGYRPNYGIADDKVVLFKKIF